MPFNGSGTYNRNFPSGGWAGDAAANIKIRADRHDTHDADLAAALSMMICKDGQSAPSADINWNSKKLLNLATPTAATDAANKGYVDGVRNFSSAISITGSLPESYVKFTGTTGPWGLSFTGGSAASGMRATDWVWNDAVDFSGTDVMKLAQTGVLTLKSPAGYTTLNLDKPVGALGNQIKGLMNNLSRWLVYVGGPEAESTGNAGSNFSIHRYDDAGTIIAGSAALSIARATGIVAMPLGATTLTQTAGNNTTAVATTAFVKAAVDTGDALQVLKAGDTMTGDLTISKATPVILLNKAASGQSSVLTAQKAGVLRWNLVLGDNTSETGGNAGSNFMLHCYTDAGAGLGTPFQINRATGDAVFSGAIALEGDMGISKDGSNNRYLTLSPTQYFVIDGSSSLRYSYSSADRFYVSGTTGHFHVTQSIYAAAGYKPGGGSWADSSDARIKTVDGPYEPGLEALLALNPVRYRFKGNDTQELPSNARTPDPNADPEAEPAEDPVTVPYPNSQHYQAALDDKSYVGLIAQEAETVLPSMVTLSEGYIDGEPVTDMRGLDTTELTFTLINAVKQLAARIEALETA